MGDFDFAVAPRTGSKPRRQQGLAASWARLKKEPAAMWWAVGAMIVAVALVAASGGLQGRSDGDAVYDARQHVKLMLNYPDTASFGWDQSVQRFGKNGFMVTSTVQAKNAFGVPQTMPWTVRLRYDENGDCEIIGAWFHE